MTLASAAVLQRAAAVRLLVLDVDGVLTDGRLYFGADGQEFKAFHIRDGLGIKLLERAGVAVAVITGRRSAAVERRMRELGIAHLYQGVDDKLAVFADLLARLQFTAQQTAYVGDDLVDLPVMRQVGLAVAVGDADPFLCRHAHWQTTSPGGQGAVREVCELLLAAQGLLDAERARYL